MAIFYHYYQSNNRFSSQTFLHLLPQIIMVIVILSRLEQKQWEREKGTEKKPLDYTWKEKFWVTGNACLFKITIQEKMLFWANFFPFLFILAIAETDVFFLTASIFCWADHIQLHLAGAAHSCFVPVKHTLSFIYVYSLRINVNR